MLGVDRGVTTGRGRLETGPTQEGRGVGTNAFRAEEAGWKPALRKMGARREMGARAW